MRKHLALILLMISSAVALHPEGYILESKLTTNYEGRLSKTLELYSYSGNGQRSQRRSFTDEDTLLPPAQRVIYSYYPTGSLASETYLTGTDTFKIKHYVYKNENRLVSIRILNGSGLLSYMDTLFYTDTFLTKEIRFTSGGDTTSYHVYTYNNSLLVSDSSFQFSGTSGTFTAQEIITYDYTSDRLVAHSIRWTLTGGRFSAKTTIMHYLQGRRIAKVLRTGTAVNGNFEDSTSYHYDDNGTLKLEGYYQWSDTISLISSMDYRWKYTGTQTIAPPLVQKIKPIVACIIENYVVIKGEHLTSALLSFTDIAGRKLMVSKKTVGNTVYIKPATFAPGKYFLFVKSAAGEYVIPVVR